MVKREAYMRKIRLWIGKEPIKVLTGIRGTGKSAILGLIQEELREAGVQDNQIICIDFEDMDCAHVTDDGVLHEEILSQAAASSGKVYLFLDEIQQVDSWEQCVSALRAALDCDIYIASSNGKLLSGEPSASLAGQYVEFEIYPFSFGEFLESHQEIKPEMSEADCFETYLLLGGMPYLTNLCYEEEAARKYLEDLFHAVMEIDIIKGNKIQDVELLKKVLAFVMENIGYRDYITFSTDLLVAYCKHQNLMESADTVLKYLKYCCDSHLIYPVASRDLDKQQLRSADEKYYTVDHGIRGAVCEGNIRNIRNLDFTLENIVYMEMKRRGYTVTVGKFGELTIDFVCEKEDERIYVQVAHQLDSNASRRFHLFDQEVLPLDMIKERAPKYLVTMDEEMTVMELQYKRIKHRNIREFLLAEKWD